MKIYWNKLYALMAVGLAGLLVVGAASLTALAQDDAPEDVEAPDTEAPTHVDNLAVAPGDAEVTLSWDAATDNVGVTGYKVYVGTESVTEPAGEYNMGPVEVGDVLDATVSGLENDVTYYFAVTALDAAGNESFDYSLEESGTPQDSADDGTHPTVVSATSANCDTLEVEFSEMVLFPEESPGNAFTIENLDNYLYLEVTDVTQSENDEATLILTTETMEENAQYLMTVSSVIEDIYGNALVSGTSDTALFSGVVCEDVVVGEEEEEEEEEEDVLDEDAPVLDDVEVVSLTEFTLTFDEATYFPTDENLDDEVDPALEVFEIFDGAGTIVEVLSVQYEETDAVDEFGNSMFDQTVLHLTTAEHLPETEYFISVVGLMDELGNATEGDFTSSTTYMTPAVVDDTPPVDEVAPEDVTDFMADVVDALVNLNWEGSLNTAGDLVDQMLYVSADGGETYEAVGSLGTDASSYSFSGGVEGSTYTFKVTTLDEAGNESQGMIIAAALPVTGVGVGLLAAASLLGGGVMARRRRK